MKNKGEKKTGIILRFFGVIPFIVTAIGLIIALIINIAGSVGSVSFIIMLTGLLIGFIAITILLILCNIKAKKYVWCNNIFLVIASIICKSGLVGFFIWGFMGMPNYEDFSSAILMTIYVYSIIIVGVVLCGILPLIGAMRGRKYTIPLRKKRQVEKMQAKQEREVLEKQKREEALQRRKEIINNQGNSATETENKKSDEGGFDGRLIQEIGWYLLGSLVTIITLGICFPLAYCWMLKWNYKAYFI